jgi:HlyD family secretion protein
MRIRHLPLVLLSLVALLPEACQSGDAKGTVHASGHIEATEVRLAAKVGGRLVLLPSHEGDVVKGGDLVARIETLDAENDLARARADLAAAASRLSLLLAGSRVEDVARAAAEAQQVHADLAEAQRDVARFEDLASRGSATLKARDDARTRAEVLDQRLVAANAELAKLRAGPRPQEIDQARAQRDSASALVATIEQRIQDASVQAPRSGVITQRAAEPGEVMPPGGLLYVLTDLSEPWLTVFVDEPSLALVHLGDPATVRVDGQSQDFVGKVVFISPVAEFTPKNVQTPEERAKLVFRIKIALDNASGIFKPGMPADADFHHGPERHSATNRPPINCKSQTRTALAANHTTPTSNG